MKNTVVDLNNYLFEQLERINDDTLEGEALDATLRKADAVRQIAEVIVKNGELALKTVKAINEYGTTPVAPPAYLLGDGSN